MPWSALPEHLNSPEKWKGTDNDTPWMRWELLIKGWFAFGPRAREWWACWQFPPRVLFKIGGTGPWRYENVQPFGASDESLHPGHVILSRCQYFKRWHLALLWPLQIQFHVYWREKDVPVEGTVWKNEFDISRLLFAYGPIHWDADLIYWIFSIYLGGQWK